MNLSKIKQYFSFNFNAFKISMYAFIVIPVVLLSYLFMFNTNEQINQIFNEPFLTAQLMLVLTYPFCFLLMKNINQNIKTKKDDCFLPLLILTFYQISSLNIVCSFLMGLALYQIYGIEIIKFKKIKMNNYTKSLLVGIIPLGMVYLLVLWVKFRLGLLW